MARTTTTTITSKVREDNQRGMKEVWEIIRVQTKWYMFGE